MQPVAAPAPLGAKIGPADAPRRRTDVRLGERQSRTVREEGQLVSRLVRQIHVPKSTTTRLGVSLHTKFLARARSTTMAKNLRNNRTTRGWSLGRKLAYSSRRARNGCLLWMGQTSSTGHGRMWWQGRLQSVSRLSFQEARGPIPRGAKVLHRCRSARCIEPKHLFAASQAVLSARIRRRKGEDNGNNKLTNREVRAIRAAKSSQREIAEEFEVSRTTVSLIRRRKTWAHLR